ncbi:MAG: RNA methyltransferase [Candidatus Falkowbacteria bacterium]|nr:RNA methyltransferase [Candidatus Falkowbacteria bacterium]
MEKITSPQNLKIKNLIKLFKGRERKKQSLIIIEGERAIEQAVRGGFLIKEIFYCPEIAKTKLSRVRFLNNKDYLSSPVSARVFNKITYAEKPDGYLALAEAKYLGLDKIKLDNRALVIVLESLEKPGNLGAILRTAYAAKVDLIIINDLKTDIYNPNVVRASEGYLFDSRVVVADKNETYNFLKKNKVKVLATSLRAKKIYTNFDFKIATAIIMGTESSGLSNDWLKLADEQIKIPMNQGIDSLNVSVSTAIILFEAWRQRGFN